MVNAEVDATKKAVVLLSGGLDSATCLAMAVSNGFSCYTLATDYGQKHRSELQAAQRLSKKLGAIQHKQVQVDLTAIGGSALTDDEVAIPDANTAADAGIPVTYVPARNTLLLSLALGYAEVLDATAIFIGVNAVDYSGYPDCRPAFIASFEELAQIATKAGVEGQPLTIHTPLIHLSKADIIKLGTELKVDYAQTVSCYQADSQGRACGRCDSCELRKQGFIAANITDPTQYM